jgi:hypothetical protein
MINQTKQNEKIDIDKIVDDLTTYAFEKDRNDSEKLVLASLMLMTAKMIYLQTLGDNGNTIYENDKNIILEEHKPTVH